MTYGRAQTCPWHDTGPGSDLPVAAIAKRARSSGKDGGKEDQASQKQCGSDADSAKATVSVMMSIAEMAAAAGQAAAGQ